MLRGVRITAGEQKRIRQRLRFIYRRTNPSLLVAEARLNTKGRAVRSRLRTGRGAATVPIFMLVPKVQLPKRAKTGPTRPGQIPGAVE